MVISTFIAVHLLRVMATQRWNADGGLSRPLALAHVRWMLAGKEIHLGHHAGEVTCPARRGRRRHRRAQALVECAEAGFSVPNQ